MLKLVIGNKNYSSWSMRPWVFLTHLGVEFEEVRIPLFVENYQQQLSEYSPTLRVPVLLDNELTVWDSLAICETISERLNGAGMPADQKVRALCRSYCAEMHSGFNAIRNQLPMNCRARKQMQIEPEVRSEADRIDSLWQQARVRFKADGDYLFGQFSMADAFYAPVASRFQTYGVQVSAEGQKYMQTLLQNEAVQAWVQAAKSEAEYLPDFELGGDLES